jgi:hypothetical protein
MRSKVDLNQLRLEIQKMTRHDDIYIFLRDELSKVDHWKLKARGNPTKAFNSRRRKGIL